jgi:hypothetical protein
MWTVCSDTKFSESIVHSLSTYTVVRCSWRRYGSFYSCSCPIAKMRKSHKAVLSGSCNNVDGHSVVDRYCFQTVQDGPVDDGQ